LEEILWNLNMSENETKDDKTCQEILDILKKPRIENKKGVFISPFKPLLKPKKNQWKEGYYIMTIIIALMRIKLFIY